MKIIGNKTGKLGEDITELYLKRQGFEILHKNYWKPYGEIDIVCQRDGKLHFVEVKAVSREIMGQNDVTRLPAGKAGESYQAEDNVHPYKLKRLGRVIQSFLMKKAYKDADWQFDVCVVTIDIEQKRAKVKFLANELLPE